MARKKTKTNRRQFLAGKSAAEALADVVAPEESPPAGRHAASTQEDSSKSTATLRVGRHAMACEFEVLLPDRQYAQGVEAAMEALDRIEQLESQLTVFDDRSEVSRINARAAHQAVRVETGLFDLLRRAVTLSEETGGAFDVTAAPLSRVWGFSRREGRLPTDADLDAARESVGSRLVQLDEEAQTVHFSRSGVEINLGAIGKGYALDRAAEVLLRAEVDDFLLHGGGSSMVARGSRAGAGESEPGWTVRVPHPLRREKKLLEIRLSDRALGTSGSGAQFFYHQGRRYGHILDPRTGQPAQGVLSATALASSGATADALATSFFVMGAKSTIEFCEKRPELGAVLVCAGSRRGTIEIHTVGLSEDQWTRLED